MKLKKLQQSNYKMKIIKDLGIVKSPTGTSGRRAIFECVSCKDEIESCIHNAKKRTLCNKCRIQKHNKSLMIPLDKNNYKMKLIKDLGMISTKTKQKVRMATFECIKCKKDFNARALNPAAYIQTKCYECTLNYKKTTLHKLYPVWNGIKQRCYSIKRKDYKKYGAIGVTMCDEWKNDAQAFIDWCENNGWRDGLVIDKDILCKKLNINPKIYAPHTISFITIQQNAEEANAKQVIQYSLDNKELARFDSARKAGNSVGVNKSCIANACRGITKTSVGFIWKYA